MTTYRVGNHQPQHVNRGDQCIGVMFTAEDAALVVEALNGLHRYAAGVDPVGPGNLFGADAHGVVGYGLFPDSCGWPNEQCIGHKPRPVAADGSGRTCPRHGALI